MEQFYGTIAGSIYVAGSLKMVLENFFILPPKKGW
jgi:hypothetical protein